MEWSEAERERVRRLAARLAGVTGPVTGLGGEHERNARVGDHIVKLYRPDADRAGLRLQDAALRHLAQSPAAGLVPRLVASSLDLPGWTDVPVRILTWLPGPLWQERASQGTALLQVVGATVARVDVELAGVHHPASGRVDGWNLLHAPLERVGELVDPARRAVAERVLRHHVEQVVPRLTTLPVQLIHNDANDRNVVLDDRGGVRGLIDFGDLAVTPRVCGLAIACAYAAMHLADPMGVGPVVAGYDAVSPLTDTELTLVPDLMRARLATSMVMAAWQSREQPGNAHLLTSHDDAYRVLRQIERIDEPTVLQRFRALCNRGSVAASERI